MHRISFPSRDDIIWPFDGKPYYRLDTRPYTHHETVDPFPCYTHDKDLVYAEVARIAAIAPKLPSIDFFVMPHEGESRTNGYAAYNRYHGEDEVHPYIVLHGKRIPIAPSMTRYLVSHEVGHVVHAFVKQALNLKDEDHQFERGYAKMRGIEYSESYGGLKWHLNTGEVLANDIRIALFDRETEFWPHDYAHPSVDPKVAAYWNEMREKYLC